MKKHNVNAEYQLQIGGFVFMQCSTFGNNYLYIISRLSLSGVFLAKNIVNNIDAIKKKNLAVSVIFSLIALKLVGGISHMIVARNIFLMAFLFHFQAKWKGIKGTGLNLNLKRINIGKTQDILDTVQISQQ